MECFSINNLMVCEVLAVIACSAALTFVIAVVLAKMYAGRAK